MVRAAGFEPAANSLECIENQYVTDSDLATYTQIRAQISDADRRLLTRVVESWPRLNSGLKLAILGILEAGKEEGGTQ